MENLIREIFLYFISAVKYGEYVKSHPNSSPQCSLHLLMRDFICSIIIRSPQDLCCNKCETAGKMQHT